MSAATDYPDLRDLLHGPTQPYHAWEVCPTCGESGSALDLHLCPEKVRVEIARLRADLADALGGDSEDEPEPMGPLRNPDSRPPLSDRAAWRGGSRPKP